MKNFKKQYSSTIQQDYYYIMNIKNSISFKLFLDGFYINNKLVKNTYELELLKLHLIKNF